METSRLSSVGDESSGSVSMYYSFSTTMGDKTIEAEEDDAIAVEVDSSQETTNSTLEAVDISESHAITVVKREQLKMESPLRAVPKNILREYKALASTPSKVVDLKCEVLKRRSVINDLGIAFLEATEAQIEPIDVPMSLGSVEDKENVPVKKKSMTPQKLMKSFENKEPKDSIEIATECMETEASRPLENTEKELADTLENVESDNTELEKEIQNPSDAESPQIEEICTSNQESSEDKIAEVNEASIELKMPEIVEETNTEVKLEIEEQNSKKIRFSMLPQAQGGRNSTQRKVPRLSLKPRKSILKPANEPDLKTNKPSRISVGKRASMAAPLKPVLTKRDKDFSPSDIPKVLSKLIREVPAAGGSKDGATTSKQSSRVSMYVEQKVRIRQAEKPFKLVTKATRMSIVKTTLNSSARRDSLKAMNTSLIKITSAVPVPRAASNISRKSVGSSRRSSILVKSRKSIAVPSSTDPTKRIRKSLAPPKPAEPVKKDAIPKPTKPVSNFKENFVCAICSRKFLVSSLFEAHKKTHQPSTSSSNVANSKQCKYCDKKFAIEKALSNHLIQNCPKIPSGDKKKLLFPSLARAKPASATVSASSSTLATSVSSNESLSTTAKPEDTTMHPPSTTKVKKKIAVHSGIYRTPTKRIECHPCKKSFNSILAYTKHCMADHKQEVPATGDETEQTQAQDSAPNALKA